MDVCLTGCNYKCASCDKDDPNICLTCRGNNRDSANSCNCEEKYFDIGINSTC